MRRAALLFLLIAACDWPRERADHQPEERAEPRSDPPPLEKAPRPTPTTPEDRRAWLALYDEAGFPDVSALRRVEFEVGRSRSADGEETIRFERAWVLSTSPLVLLQDSLWPLEPECTVEIPESMRALEQALPDVPKQPPREPRSYRDVNFADELRAELDSVESLPDEDAFELSGWFGPPVAYWLVRARWAEMRGATDLAVRALAQIERWSAIHCNQDCTVEAGIRNSFQDTLLWQARDGIGGFMPRPMARELVLRARTIAPYGNNAALVAELLGRLNRTIATDAKEWPEGEPPRVERLIYLLREQGGHQRGQTGFCDAFAVVGPIRDPAAELRELGREAIPALIEHLDDDTLTRSTLGTGDGDFYRVARSVGDMAHWIIEQIAGRRFYLDYETSLAMSGEDRAKAIQKLVREWWAEARELSPPEQLVRDLDDAEESERHRIAVNLLDKYGMAIWPELVRSFGETKDDKARVDLLNAIHHSSGERETIEHFLVRALADRSINVRLAAATALAVRDRHEGTETIVREFDQNRLDLQTWDDAHIESYIGLLLADGSAAAVDALDRALRVRGYPVLAGLTSRCWWNDQCGRDLDPAAKARLLDSLAALFDDFGGPAGKYDGGPARTRDEAAEAYARLTDRDPGSLASGRATLIERDRLILEMLNAHRAQRGQAPVSWPHVVAPQGTQGRDHVQRVHLLHARVHEAAAREWLEGFGDRNLDPREVTTALVHLAERYPEVPFTLRILRFPDDAGVILTLEVGARTSFKSYERFETTTTSARCTSISSSSEPAPEVFANFLRHDLEPAWHQTPTQIEEYLLRVRASPSGARSALGCQCTASEDSDWGWLVLIAGLVPIRLARRRRSQSRRFLGRSGLRAQDCGQCPGPKSSPRDPASPRARRPKERSSTT